MELARLSFETAGTKSRKKSDRHLTWLKDALTPVTKSDDYDVILIDCPPLGKLTLSVLIAADGILIPLQCEYYALQGISSITDLMDQLKISGVNKGLELIRVLMTMFDVGQTCPDWSWMREHFNDKVFRTVIPRATRVANPQSRQTDPALRSLQCWFCLLRGCRSRVSEAAGLD